MTKLLRKLMQFAGAVLAAGAIAVSTGCDSGGDDDGGGGGGGGSVVGRYEMVWQDGGGTTWWQFNEDGTYAYYNDAGFNSKHISGTYSQDGNRITGPFENPGVGSGEIDAILSDDGKSLQIDFIEHWHSPYKHVPLAGTRI